MDPFDLVGDVLDGQFKVEEFVGEGALSVLYRATNEAMSAPVAVKCLNLPQTLDEAFQASITESFVEGAKLHFKLARGHLAIAQTFASGTTVAPRTGAQIPYIVREWFEGESLARNLRKRRTEGEHGRSLEETLAMFDPIASALAYAHEQDAAHLSLMPSNLFLARLGDGEVTLKLLDFGVGRVVDRHGRSPSVIDEAASTRKGAAAVPRMKVLLPTYAAPEQLLGTLGPTGPWTDVYALALVLLEVLSDRPVNGAKDASAVAARVLSATERPTPESHGVDLPPDVSAILTRALALEPESRQTSVAEMWSDLTLAVRPPIDDPRKERRRLATFLRRLRRARRVDARIAEKPMSIPPLSPVRQVSGEFGDEAPTTKARGVVAMLTARAHRSSTRPPPPAMVPPKPTKKPPPPRTTAPAPALPTSPAKRAPQHTLLGLAGPLEIPPLPAKPKAHSPSPPPAVTVSPAIFPPPPAIFPPPPAIFPPPPAISPPAPEVPPPPPEMFAVLSAMSATASAIPPAPPARSTKPAAPTTRAMSALPSEIPPPPPSPSPPMVGAPPELASIIVAREAPPPQPPAMESAGRLEPHEIPVLASPFARPRAPLDRRVVIGVGIGTGALLVLFILVVALARHTNDATARTADNTERSPFFAVPSATTPPSLSASALTSATALATAAASTPPPPPKRPGPFNRKQAVATVIAATADLGDCSRKHGVWGIGQAGVTFTNEGNVRRVYMSAPFNGVEGKCVTKHIEDDAHVDPFNGIWGPVYVKFTVPYAPP